MFYTISIFLYPHEQFTWIVFVGYFHSTLMFAKKEYWPKASRHVYHMFVERTGGQGGIIQTPETYVLRKETQDHV
jgi:hypothetical protein